MSRTYIMSRTSMASAPYVDCSSIVPPSDSLDTALSYSGNALFPSAILAMAPRPIEAIE